MPPLLSERLRQALRDFKQVCAARARLELETETSFRERSQVIERECQERLEHIDGVYREGLTGAEREFDEARTNILAVFDGEETRARQEADRAKRGAIQRYARTKEQVQGDFQEARWTITTVHDAGRKVAKDQLAAAQTRAELSVEQLQAQTQQALGILKEWQFANDLADVSTPAELVPAADPWEALQNCTAQGTDSLAKMQSLKLPHYVRGMRPFLVIGLVWLLASLPALVLTDLNVVYWLAITTATILPVGLLIRWWLKVMARTQAVYLWGGLSQAAHDAAQLAPRCLALAKQAYRKQKVENKRRNQAALYQSATTTKKTIKGLRQDRNRKLRQAQATFEPLVRRLTERRDHDLLVVETTFQEKQTAFERARDEQAEEIGTRFKRLRDDVNRHHADDWTRLVSLWKQGCDHFIADSLAVDQETRRWFPRWYDPVWRSWQLPEDVPLGLPLGRLDVRLEDIPHGVPQENHLQRPNLSSICFPILLPFPERAALLFKAHDEGKAHALQSLQALLMRCWTALPAGAARCTIIDPVGRGENFAAFMHLADYEESLVNSRIWTEAAHIDQRLADLTAHMETVLQKYLRNQYETLAEYNAEAGEVAEPYRFLVVADFPVNFTPEAARRLISLAGAGARCGIYTFIMVDVRQTLPQGMDLADLQRVCSNFTWKHDRFAWNDPDFGCFPMELEPPPDAEACTSLLRIAGEAAKRAGRVEVPFAFIATAPENWWRQDSRSGLSVPLGRAGATARQHLTLGQGTSQHVLIAGKTGSGKSTLLHVLIAQLATHYSPHEVELYLIDFKKGVEFKTYAANELPHARVVAIESEREFGLSVLQRLDAELMRRGELFRAAGVNDLPGYRNATEPGATNGKPQHDKAPASALPRVVLIVDEFQEFFVEDDKISQEAALFLDRLVRQGRAFGMHVLLGSQTLGGAYSLARSTIDQMAVRIALQCSETDAHLILSKDNSDARLLSRPGEAIYNAAGGLLEGNHLFQVVWLGDQERDRCLANVRRLGEQHDLRTSQIVFEGTAPADIAKNPLLVEAVSKPAHRGSHDPVMAWLGEPVAIKDPTAAVFRRRSGGNLLMIGQQDELAFSMTVAVLVSLSTQLPPADQQSVMTVVVASQVEGDGAAVQNLLPELLPVRLATGRELPATLERLAEEMNRRLKGETDGPPRFLFLHGLQRLRDLRRPDDDFGFSRKTEATVSPYKQFLNILREGPPLGIFTILWCDTLANLQRTFDRQSLREFDMRVLFQMSPTDSSTLIDTPLASRLGLYRALLYTEDQGRLEKFRPYGLPTVEWLRKVARRP
jgi:energy-coupling factor transporter ATP-binding protein EcfA2